MLWEAQVRFGFCTTKHKGSASAASHARGEGRLLTSQWLISLR